MTQIPLTETQVRDGFVLISTTPKQADWNERFAKALANYREVCQRFGYLALIGETDEVVQARAEVAAANARLDALDVEAENILAEQDEEALSN